MILECNNAKEKKHEYWPKSVITVNKIVDANSFKKIFVKSAH